MLFWIYFSMTLKINVDSTNISYEDCNRKLFNSSGLSLEIRKKSWFQVWKTFWMSEILFFSSKYHRKQVLINATLSLVILFSFFFSFFFREGGIWREEILQIGFPLVDSLFSGNFHVVILISKTELLWSNFF